MCSPFAPLSDFGGVLGHPFYTHSCISGPAPLPPTAALISLQNLPLFFLLVIHGSCWEGAKRDGKTLVLQFWVSLQPSWDQISWSASLFWSANVEVLPCPMKNFSWWWSNTSSCKYFQKGFRNFNSGRRTLTLQTAACNSALNGKMVLSKLEFWLIDQAAILLPKNVASPLCQEAFSLICIVLGKAV